MIDGFNAYSKEHGLDITVKLELLTSNNSTTESDYYVSVIDMLLKKKSDKYNIYFYDNIYTPRFSNHFIDLKKYLEEEHINLYPEALKSEAFSYNDKLVGLVIYMTKYILYKYILII